MRPIRAENSQDFVHGSFSKVELLVVVVESESENRGCGGCGFDSACKCREKGKKVEKSKLLLSGRGRRKYVMHRCNADRGLQMCLSNKSSALVIGWERRMLKEI